MYNYDIEQEFFCKKSYDQILNQQKKLLEKSFNWKF